MGEVGEVVVELDDAGAWARLDVTGARVSVFSVTTIFSYAPTSLESISIQGTDDVVVARWAAMRAAVYGGKGPAVEAVAAAIAECRAAKVRKAAK